MRKPIVFIILSTIIIMVCSGCYKEKIEPKPPTTLESVQTSTPSSTTATTPTSKENTIDNTILEPAVQNVIDLNEFLASFEGTQYQASSFCFAKALLNGNYDYISDNIIDQKNLEKYDYVDNFATIECMFFRVQEYNKEDLTVAGECVIQLTKDDGYRYIEFKMKFVDDKWKIVDYIIDA